MYQDAVPAGPMPAGLQKSWQPKELGTTRATLLAVLLVLVIGGFCYYAGVTLTPKPPPTVVQVTQAHLTELPQPTPPPPPPPPKVVPPPKPLPAVIPKPPPIPSKIVVATKPPPPVHHIVKPVPRPVHHVEQPPPPETKPVTQPTPPQPPAPSNDGKAAYGDAMHAIIQANQDVPQALAQLGVSGTAIIEIQVAPDGHVVSATVLKSSGVPLIDSTALDHAREARLPPFNANMIGQTQAFIIPIEIDGEDASQ